MTNQIETPITQEEFKAKELELVQAHHQALLKNIEARLIENQLQVMQSLINIQQVASRT